MINHQVLFILNPSPNPFPYCLREGALHYGDYGFVPSPYLFKGRARVGFRRQIEKSSINYINHNPLS
jgi:hypothetical protein